MFLVFMIRLVFPDEGDCDDLAVLWNLSYVPILLAVLLCMEEEFWGLRPTFTSIAFIVHELASLRVEHRVAEKKLLGLHGTILLIDLSGINSICIDGPIVQMAGRDPCGLITAVSTSFALAKLIIHRFNSCWGHTSYSLVS